MCLRFYPYPEPKRAGVSLCGTPMFKLKMESYIFPEYADCQKTLVGASIARPCPFACEKTYPEKALLRQVGGRPMVAPRAIPHNSKCRYGERGAADAKPKAQIILDVLSSILATQMPCRTPSRSEALRSATAACGGSWRGDPPERCLSRKAGIMRCCPRYSIGHECDFLTRRSMSRS